MNIKKTLGLLSICSALLTCTAFADDANAVGKSSASVLNVRAGKSTSSAIIGRLNYGDQINIITKSGGWYKIQFSGGIGYVSAEYMVADRHGNPVLYDKTADYSIQSLEGMEKGQQVVEIAKRYLGVPYVYGGSTPAGFDCSGLVQYVYREMGVNINRVAADQTAHGIPVTRAELKPGDIVFFHNTNKYTRINHVGIYGGDGNLIHAAQTGDVVKITTLDSGYYQSTLVTARRIFE